MSKSKLIYTESRKISPVSYWVHYGMDEHDRPYSQCDDYTPPFPPKDPVKGYPYLLVTVIGFELEFASSLELDHCIEILMQRNLPTTTYLSEQRGTGQGPNSHWLSRLPSELKSWSKRERIVAALIKAKEKLLSEKIRF